MTHGEPTEPQLAQQAIDQPLLDETDYAALSAQIISSAEKYNDFGREGFNAYLATNLRSQAALANARHDYVTSSARHKAELGPEVSRAADIVSDLCNLRVPLQDGTYNNWGICSLARSSALGIDKLPDATWDVLDGHNASQQDATRAMNFVLDERSLALPDEAISDEVYDRLGNFLNEVESGKTQYVTLLDVFEHCPSAEAVKVHQLHALAKIVSITRTNHLATRMINDGHIKLSSDQKKQYLQDQEFAARVDTYAAALILSSVRDLYYPKTSAEMLRESRNRIESAFMLKARQRRRLNHVKDGRKYLEAVEDMSPVASEAFEAARTVRKGDFILQRMITVDGYAEQKIEKTWRNKVVESVCGYMDEYCSGVYKLVCAIGEDYFPDVDFRGIPEPIQDSLVEVESMILSGMRQEIQALLDEGAISGKDFRIIDEHLVGHAAREVDEARGKENRQSYEQGLLELDEFIAQHKSEIALLEQPYEYTSKRLRSHEEGTKRFRDLSIFLDKHNALNDESARRMLTLMLLDSECANDPNDYFARLKQTRFAIEEQLANLQFAGVDHNSEVTTVLRWVDEMLDAGEPVNFKPLEYFMEQYFLSDFGVIEDTVSDTDEPEPTPGLPGEPVPEEPEPDRTAAEEIIQEYFATLASVLEEAGVLFSDVAVFPPGSTPAGSERSGDAQRPVTGFIDIDPRRLHGLIDMKHTFEKQGRHAQIILTAPTRWSTLPYFALVVKDSPSDTHSVCFLENVQHGTATYSFAVDGELIRSWEEVAMMSRPQAREFGAIPKVHPDKQDPTFSRHYALTLRHFAETQLARLAQVPTP